MPDRFRRRFAASAVLHASICSQLMGFCTELTLIRHLLDHVPYAPVPDTPLDLPPLARPPAKERFKWWP